MMIRIKKICSILLLALVTIPAASQNIQQIQDALKMGENQLVEDAVKDAFVMVNTYYALQTDKGKKYGRDMHDYFGSRCYVGYSLADGYVTTADALSPWETDEAYSDFRDDSKYTPVLLDSIMVRNVDGEGKVRGRISNESTLFEQTGIVKLQLYPDEKNTLVGTVEGTNRGWLVFAMIPKEKKGVIDRKTTFTFTSKVMTVKENGMMVSEPQRSKETIVGGIFVVPQMKKTGLVEMQVKAILVKNGEGKWKLVNCEKEWFSTEKQAEEQSQEEPYVEEGTNVEGTNSTEEPFAIPSRDKKKKKPQLNRID